MSARVRILLLLFVLLTVIASAFPRGSAYRFSTYSICKGWTDERIPIEAQRYVPGDTVYLYFEIEWVSLTEFEAKWKELPVFGIRGAISAGRVEEYFPMISFSIELSSPRGEVVNSFKDRYMEEVLFKPPDAIASAFLEILNVTSTTENGIWRLKWHDKTDLVFAEEFLVGAPIPETTTRTTTPIPETTTAAGPPSLPTTRTLFEKYVVSIIVAVSVVVVLFLAFWRARSAKLRVPEPPSRVVGPVALARVVTPSVGVAQEAPRPTAPTQEIARPAGVKYCIQCGELIPEVAVYCPRCASRQE